MIFVCSSMSVRLTRSCLISIYFSFNFCSYCSVSPFRLLLPVIYKFLKFTTAWAYFLRDSSISAWSCLFFRVIKADSFSCSQRIDIISLWSCAICWFKPNTRSFKASYFFLKLSIATLISACHFHFAKPIFALSPKLDS